MSSSHGDKRSSDVEMGEATSPAPILTSPVRAGAEFPSSSALAIAPGHGTEDVTPRDAGTLAGLGIPDASALPSGSSTNPILVEDKERAADSMPPHPARKEIVLALRAPSVVPVAQPKGRKRKFTKGGDGESSQQGGSSIASGLREKFISLIDGMISECGSETSHLAGELLELQGRWSETEAMLTAVEDFHSVKVSKLEVAIGELERDLGKTVSSLLKEKKARKDKSSEVRRLQHQIEGDAGLASSGIREATYALRSEFQARLAKISAFLGSLECIQNMDLALATIEGGVAVVQSFQSSGVPDASALPAGSSTTPILVEDKERAADSMPPPPARKEIVLALRAPSVVPVAQPKGRKRKFTKGGDGESSQQGGSSIASGLRGKFMSLIDGMISECGSETSRLTGELLELQGRRSGTKAMLTAVKDSHSVKVSKLEVAIGELERDLGKMASSLLKEKKARKAKSSEVRRLQRQIEGDAGLTSRGIREATDALHFEFQARLAKISAFLGSLECIRNRDFALATIEGGVAMVQSFQSETPTTLEAKEARLSGCKGDLAVVDGDFDLILADLKSACFLPTCSEDPEGKIRCSEKAEVMQLQAWMKRWVKREREF
ncbi:hypothetical protein F2Q68_00033766 [Brassica cretica]|uniref:Uncharacterized protein n=2 Tax=Brassica cretica TaxID=69181 RepID=A0A8S9H5Q8_BRACR|nr:hypothetical protein F2Q68_00033766 [Brassica cretica]